MDGTAFERLTVAAAVASDELYTLRELGFDVVPVSTGVLNAGFDWAGVDVLMVSSGLSHGQLDATARSSLDAFLARGGVVTRGSTGASFNAAAGLLTLTSVAGRGDANGVVDVVNTGGPVTADAPSHAFVSAPRWFTGLGAEVSVEQRFGDGDVLVSGQWRANADGTGGQDAAAGQAVVVRGRDERGAAVVMFGSEPLYRNHPKGMFAQVARSLFWTAASASAPAVAQQVVATQP